MRGLLKRYVPLLLLGLAFAFWFPSDEMAGPTFFEPHPLAHNVYVWQRVWTPPVVDAVRRCGPAFETVMVLAGEARKSSEGPVFDEVAVDWPALALLGGHTTLVFRADTRVTALLENDVAGLSSFLSDGMISALTTAQQAGVNVAGLQLDFDCPTSRLGRYADLADHLRCRFPNLSLSITALPTWMESDNWPRLAKGVDYFVLQVHSLEVPRDGRPIPALCDVERIPRYLMTAARLGVPFYLALPTYGYRVLSDRAGRIAAIAAEGTEARGTPGDSAPVVRADPVALAQVVRDLRASSPRSLKGIVWFRLPVESDDLNWSWPALESVMAGRDPALRLDVRLQHPSEGLYEIWLANSGQYSPVEPVVVRADWDGPSVKAQDSINGFSEESSVEDTARYLKGTAPEPGKDVMIGWYVLTGPPGPKHSITVVERKDNVCSEDKG